SRPVAAYALSPRPRCVWLAVMFIAMAIEAEKSEGEMEGEREREKKRAVWRRVVATSSRRCSAALVCSCLAVWAASTGSMCYSYAGILFWLLGVCVCV